MNNFYKFFFTNILILSKISIALIELMTNKHEDKNKATDTCRQTRALHVSRFP